MFITTFQQKKKAVTVVLYSFPRLKEGKKKKKLQKEQGRPAIRTVFSH